MSNRCQRASGRFSSAAEAGRRGVIPATWEETAKHLDQADSGSAFCLDLAMVPGLLNGSGHSNAM
ncbi:hypothetical protein VPH49_23970 [Pseudomonas luteola]|uniref:hypothetical protein n=1 Tax=Pseudomonas luteola TaxID=47886 RepID=UPI0012390DB9|nr:hypothetical protein [Pseudomonas luteola]QEU26271.1 hypothetical protein FOB45_00130 [Pseudomonas luteola]